MKDKLDSCPRCGGDQFTKHDCGPDTYEDDITYTSYSCDRCGLWYDGWRDDWFEADSWIDVEDLEPWKG